MLYITIKDLDNLKSKISKALTLAKRRDLKVIVFFLDGKAQLDGFEDKISKIPGVETLDWAGQKMFLVKNMRILTKQIDIAL